MYLPHVRRHDMFGGEWQIHIRILTLRYLPYFFHVHVSHVVARMPGVGFKNGKVSTIHHSLCILLHGFLHGDTETTTDRGKLWLGAIWYVAVIYFVLGCNVLYKYGVRIYTSFPRP